MRQAVKLRLVKTCSACPEQYNVYDGEKQVGYMRLRHSYFRVNCPDERGETVYASLDVKGDGSFANEDERKCHLNRGCAAILERIHGDVEDLYEIEEPE